MHSPIMFMTVIAVGALVGAKSCAQSAQELRGPSPLVTIEHVGIWTHKWRCNLLCKPVSHLYERLITWRRERDSFFEPSFRRCKLLILISARRAKNGRKANRGHNLGTVDWG